MFHTGFFYNISAHNSCYNIIALVQLEIFHLGSQGDIM